MYIGNFSMLGACKTTGAKKEIEEKKEEKKEEKEEGKERKDCSYLLHCQSTVCLAYSTKCFSRCKK